MPKLNYGVRRSSTFLWRVMLNFIVYMVESQNLLDSLKARGPVPGFRSIGRKDGVRFECVDPRGVRLGGKWLSNIDFSSIMLPQAIHCTIRCELGPREQSRRHSAAGIAGLLLLCVAGQLILRRLINAGIEQTGVTPTGKFAAFMACWVYSFLLLVGLIWNAGRIFVDSLQADHLLEEYLRERVTEMGGTMAGVPLADPSRCHRNVALAFGCFVGALLISLLVLVHAIAWPLISFAMTLAACGFLQGSDLLAPPNRRRAGYEGSYRLFPFLLCAPVLSLSGLELPGTSGPEGLIFLVGCLIVVLVVVVLYGTRLNRNALGVDVGCGLSLVPDAPFRRLCPFWAPAYVLGAVLAGINSCFGVVAFLRNPSGATALTLPFLLFLLGVYAATFYPVIRTGVPDSDRLEGVLQKVLARFRRGGHLRSVHVSLSGHLTDLGVFGPAVLCTSVLRNHWTIVVPPYFAGLSTQSVEALFAHELSHVVITGARIRGLSLVGKLLLVGGGALCPPFLNDRHEYLSDQLAITQLVRAKEGAQQLRRAVYEASALTLMRATSQAYAEFVRSPCRWAGYFLRGGHPIHLCFSSGRNLSGVEQPAARH